MSFLPVETKPRAPVSYHVGRALDGMRTAGLDGFPIQVYGPAWWQVGRWLRLAFNRSRVRIEVVFRSRFYTVWAVDEASPRRHR